MVGFEESEGGGILNPVPYINQYSNLEPQELRQLRFKRMFKEENPSWDDSMVLLRDLVAAYLPEKANVLDAGCGHGNFVIDESRPRIAHAVGIDVNSDVTSKNICLDEIAFGRLEKLPFPDASFDTVVSLWVLEHISEPKKVFSEIARVLKPGGYFAFVTPNKKSWLIALRRIMSQRIADRIVDRLYGRKESDVFSVVYRANSLSQVRSLAEAAGFQVRKLIENPDPTYTSFGWVTYRISALLSQLPCSLFRVHIVGILQKKS